MIRIDLKVRAPRYRSLVIAGGLSVAVVAFGAAIYTLDRQVSLRSLWARPVPRAPAAPPLAPEPAVPASVMTPAPVADGGGQKDVSAAVAWASNAASSSLALVNRLPAAVRISTLAADAAGGFVMEGEFDDSVTLAQVLDSLRPHTLDIRGTSWTSGGERVAACRIVGDVDAPSDTALEPVSAAQLTVLTTLANRLAAASGLRSVQVDAPRTEATDGGLSLYRFDLRATGPPTSVLRFVPSLADLGTQARIAHLAVVRSPDNNSTRQLTLSFDAVVREPPPGGSR